LTRWAPHESLGGKDSLVALVVIAAADAQSESYLLLHHSARTTLVAAEGHHEEREARMLADVIMRRPQGLNSGRRLAERREPRLRYAIIEANGRAGADRAQHRHGTCASSFPKELCYAKRLGIRRDWGGYRGSDPANRGGS
jgi:hypothetical protein